MRPRVPSVGVALVLAIALWAFWPRSERSPTQSGGTTSATTSLVPMIANPPGPAESAQSAASARSAAADVRPSGPRKPSAAQQQLRERVLQSLRHREARGSIVPAAASAPLGGAGGESDHVPGEGTMKDRTGLMGDEVKVINRELMPMVDQCVNEAHERNPRLHGMLALAVKLASAEGIGSIFESVEPSATNEVDDAEMIDCIRQSAFTISLPPPKADSMHEGMMTIPIEALADAGSN